MTSVPSRDDVDLDFGATIRGFAAGQRLFDRYKLKEILGRGGMGIVWKAYDEHLERDVALKFLPELVAFDEQAIKDLKRETKKSQELRHHHIVQVYDFVTDKQNACISMECVDGPTLSALKARKEQSFFEVDEIKPWIEQLCDALAYAHEKARVVHRDLKPANLMIDSKNQLKVTDFGIARSVSDSVSMLTMAHGTSGTLVYMSPQQLAGQRASHLDDIYSLGTTIYELLTSKPPFYSGDVTDQIKHATPGSMQKRREDVEITTARIPKEWEETVAKCLAKDPAIRPKSTGEIAQRLGLRVPQYGALVPASSQVAAVDLNRHPPKVPKSSPRREMVIGALVIITLIGAGLGWYFGIYAPKKQAQEKPQTTVAEQKKPEATVAPSGAPSSPIAQAPTREDLARREVRLRVPIEPRFERQGSGEFKYWLLKAKAWGMVDGTGTTVLEPKWDDIYFLPKDDLYTVERGGKWGVIDKEGKVLIEPQWDSILFFQDGLAAVKRGEKYGYIDKSGNVVIKPEWSFAQAFGEGLAAVSRGKEWDFKWGLIDKSGNLALNTKWNSAGVFSEGLMPVGVQQKSSYTSKWGFIDKTGNFVIRPQWDYASSFKDGLAPIQRGDKMGFIDKNGNVVIEPQWDFTGGPYEGQLVVSRNKKWGQIDKNGNIIVEPQWDTAFYFVGGLATVKRGDKYGIIDKSGNARIELNWDYAYVQKDESGAIYIFLAKFKNDNGRNGPAEAKWIDESGKIIWSSEQLSSQPIEKSPEFEAAAKLRQDGKLPEARAALTAFVLKYPTSPHADGARDLLGEINTDIFLSRTPSPEKEEYIVKPGDVLQKIAHNMKSTPELIMRMNNLSGALLHIGEHLLISHPDFSIVVQRKPKLVVLLNHGAFFKQYHVREEKLPAKQPATVTTKVAEVMAWRDGKRVGFGTKEYIGSTRWIQLAAQAYTIYSVPDADHPALSQPPPQQGLGLGATDVEELSSLVNDRTPVTITD